MNKLTRDPENLHFIIDAKNEPKIHIYPGEELIVETDRADGMFLSRENPVFRDHAHVMTVQSNPVTGPIYVEGAMPGDKLSVKILDIFPGDDDSEGYSTYVPGQGVFANEFYPNLDYPPFTKWCEVNQDTLEVRFGDKKFKMDTVPFIGTIAVAHSKDVMASYWMAKEILGNVDCRFITKGSTLVLPINVEGALLSLGDMHARQGAGELLGCAIECRGSVVISVEVIKFAEIKYYGWPQVNTDTFIGSIGCVQNSMDQAVRYAVYDIIKRVECMCDISFMEAYMIIGQCVEIEICQIVGGFCTVIAKINRSFLSFE